jgi:hypothetical protein
LRLLEQAHPERSQGDLLAMLDAIPDRKAAKSPAKPVQRRLGSRPRTDASMERRRRWASSGAMPPQLQARFTLAESAVLAVVAAEVVRHGACTLTLDHIAALAGVSRSTVKNAMRQGAVLGVIRVEERRVSAWRNAPNRVTITSPEWCAWMRMRRRGVESNSCPPRIQADNLGTSAQREWRRAAGRQWVGSGGARRDSGRTTGHSS